MQGDALVNLTEAKFKQEAWSAAHAAFGVLIALCVLAGICGTIYKLIEPGGWMAQVFGRSATAGAVTLAALVLIAGLSWFTSGSVRLRTRVSETVLYGLAAAGLFYLARLFTMGTL